MAFPIETFVQFVADAPLANPPGPSDVFALVQGNLLKQLPANSLPVLYTSPTVVINLSLYNATINNQTILVNRSPAAATTINLPSNPGVGRIIQVKDIAGNAGTGNITLSNCTVDGSPGLTINTDYGYTRLISTGIGNNWAIIT